MSEDALDGCAIDFKEEPETSAEEVEAMLVPKGEEEDEDDD